VRTARGSPLISAILHDQRIGKLPNPELKGATSNGWFSPDATHLGFAGTDLLNDLRLLVLQSFNAGSGRGDFKAEDERNEQRREDQRTPCDYSRELKSEETRALRCAPRGDADAAARERPCCDRCPRTCRAGRWTRAGSN
jgi:hypothetical protein